MTIASWQAEQFGAMVDEYQDQHCDNCGVQKRLAGDPHGKGLIFEILVTGTYGSRDEAHAAGTLTISASDKASRRICHLLSETR